MESVRNMCRVCLKAENSVSLLNWNLPVEDINENLSYAECFQHCTQLNLLLNKEYDINEHSLRICEHFCYSCAAKLKEAYVFIRKAKEADITLRMNYWKLDTGGDKKFFEWVGVGKDNTSIDIKEGQSDEELLTLESNNLMNENSSSKDFIMKTCEENSSKSENLRPLKSTTSKKSTRANSKFKKESKIIRTKIGRVDEVEFCRICEKSVRKSRHSCKRSIGIFLCKSCPRTFRHRNTLIQHEHIHENNRERKFACGECGKKFFTQGARKNHLKTHDPTRKPLFHCNDCGQSFLFKGSLLVHQQKHSGQMIQCKYCQKSYVRYVDLEIHLRSHTGDTPFKCDKCEKAFTKMSSLRKHSQLHEGVQWKCKDCGKEYLYEWTLKKHRLEHTGLPLRCSICDKGFPEMYKIRRHIQNVHKINQPEIENFVVWLKEKKKSGIITQRVTEKAEEIPVLN